MKSTGTLKDYIYETIHRNSKNIKILADELGISENLLYKYGYDGDNGTDLPLGRLIPLMKVTENYTILQHIAHLCGFVCVKLPKFKAVKGETFEIINGYQESTTKCIREMKKFFDQPSEDTLKNVNDALKEVIQLSVSNSHYCDKMHKAQYDMEL